MYKINTRKIIFFLLIMVMGNVLMPQKVTAGFNAKTAAYIMAVVTGGTSIWAYIERSKKISMSNQLEHIKKEARDSAELLVQKHTETVKKIQQELDKYKTESIELENDQALICAIQDFLQFVHYTYAKEIKLLSSSSEVNAYRKPLLELIKSRAAKESLDILEKQLNKDFKLNIAYKHQVEVKLLEWNTRQSRQQYKTQGQELLTQLQDLEVLFKTLVVTLKEQYDFLKLALLIDKNYEHEYAYELKLVNTYSEITQCAHILDKHIRAQYSDERFQFPYLSYAQKISKDYTKIKEALSELSGAQLLEDQEATLNQAHMLLQFLERLLEHIVSSDEYIQEKKQKPEFDRQEKLIQAQIYEKQARIEQEKRVAELKLQEEHNKTQQLANQHAELELARKQLEIKEREISLEWSRIRDGETVREAIAKNNREWQYYYDRLQSDYNQLKVQKQELERTADTVRQELSRLKATHVAPA